MKDYRLSEIRDICSKHIIKEGHDNCKFCPFVDDHGDCPFFDYKEVPFKWEIDEGE